MNAVPRRRQRFSPGPGKAAARRAAPFLAFLAAAFPGRSGARAAGVPGNPSTGPGSPVNVRRLGAKGDGKTDDTAAFLAAVARAGKEHGRVVVPPGAYVISKPIRIERLGLSAAGANLRAWPADADVMPAIIPKHRDAPAFILGAGAALAGLDITYHWRREPTTGPAAVTVAGVGVYIHNLRIRYAWNGIVTDGRHNAGRLNIADVFMVAIRNIGVRVTGTWDVPRLANVEVWNAGITKHAIEHGIGFLLGKNDLIRMSDCFAFGMRYGFLFQEKLPDCKIQGKTWGVLHGCATDFCVQGLVVHGDHTLSIAGGSFWDHQESLVVDGANARVRVAGSELKSNGASAIVVRRADQVAVNGCTILRTMAAFTAPAVHLEGGNTVLAGNQISCNRPAVVVDKTDACAVITGNLIRSPGPGIVSGGGRDTVLVRDNLLRPLPPPPASRRSGAKK